MGLTELRGVLELLEFEERICEAKFLKNEAITNSKKIKSAIKTSAISHIKIILKQMLKANFSRLEITIMKGWGDERGTIGKLNPLLPR